MSAQESVIKELKSYFNSEEWKKLRSKNPKYIDWIENLTDKDIFFGDSPKFIKGKVWGNSTGVGESTYGNTTTQRTISMDHISLNKCFVDLSNKADKRTLRRAFENFGFTSEKFYYQNQAADIAREDGKRETRSSLYDLNFTPKSHRLNRYHIEYTSGVINCSIWPIFAKNGEKNVFIGFWEEHDGKAELDFEIKPPMTPVKKLITFGVIAVAVIVGLLIIL